jgi:hypothetical protein
MIIPNSDQISASRPSVIQSAPPEAMTAHEQEICRRQLELLVRQIEPPTIREIVGTVFQDLLRLLECLTLVEGHLRQVDCAGETFEFFQLIHDEANALVNFIRIDALNTVVMGDELADTLDGVAFAVQHDLQRVFDTVPGESFEDNPAQIVVGKLYRAHDVLTNCLQQSTITLAMVFDPTLVGTKLFNNSDIRYRQSLQLCHELSDIIVLVENSEKIGSTLPTLINRIEKFRNECMECLMYSDWPQFESFCERVRSSKNQPHELVTVLHQFRCYLETLLSQVRMRNVLADVFPLGIGEEANCGVLTALARNSASFSESFQSQDRALVWSEEALAL